MAEKIKFLLLLFIFSMMIIDCDIFSNNNNNQPIIENVYLLPQTEGKIRIMGLSEYNGKYACILKVFSKENENYFALVGVNIDEKSISSENGSFIYNCQQIEKGEVIISLYGMTYSSDCNGNIFGSYSGTDTLDLDLFIRDTNFFLSNEDSIKITIHQVPFLDGKAVVSIQ